MGKVIHNKLKDYKRTKRKQRKHVPITLEKRKASSGVTFMGRYVGKA